MRWKSSPINSTLPAGRCGAFLILHEQDVSRLDPTETLYLTAGTCSGEFTSSGGGVKPPLPRTETMPSLRHQSTSYHHILGHTFRPPRSVLHSGLEAPAPL